MTDLRGHVAIVTGGNGGIGLGMAEGIAKAGGDVMIWSRNAEKNAAATEQLAALGVRAESLICDVGHEEQIVESMARTIETMGRVDSMFANAGRAGTGTPFLDLPLEEWRAVLDINLDGVFLCLREAAKQMVAQGSGGSLVGVSSTSAIHGAAGNEAYGTAKTAVLGLVRALSVALARHQIRVNAVSPGWTKTDLAMGAYSNEKFLDVTTRRTPARRWAEPEEFNQVGAFLADPSLTFHTGQNLVVDGGYTVF